MLLRAVHLGADTPPQIDPGSAALYVDEGYKTLSPRNVILFGREHWNPNDDYSGWTWRSPLTQASFYLAFSAFGATVYSARGVSVFYFALLLASYAIAMRARYRFTVYILGLVVLGLESTIFFFSRAALIEIPLCTILYALLFSLPRLSRDGARLPMLLTVVAAGFAALGLKATAILYFLPVLAATLLYSLRETNAPWFTRYGWFSRYGALTAVAIIALGAGLFATFDLWWRGFAPLTPERIARRILFPPIIEQSPFVVLLGLVCALSALSTRPRLYLQDLYRLSLLSILLIGPVLLAFVSNPFRYYVPLLPAYLLFFVEWVELRAWQQPQQRSSGWLRLALIGLLVVLLFYAGVAVDRERGFISGWTLLLVSMLGAVFVWMRRFQLLGPKSLATVAAALGLALAAGSGATIGSFLVAPSYHATDIGKRLSRIVKDGESVAGDWAPFLTLGTGIRSLYVNDRVNAPNRIRDLAPTYYLYNEKPYTEALSLKAVAKAGQVSFGNAIALGTYNQRAVSLYRISYGDLAKPGATH